MRKNSRITIKNELPELLEAVCEHPRCPKWLKEAIWDAVNDQTHVMVYNAAYWRGQLESMRPPYLGRCPLCMVSKFIEDSGYCAKCEREQGIVPTVDAEPPALEGGVQ